MLCRKRPRRFRLVAADATTSRAGEGVDGGPELGDIERFFEDGLHAQVFVGPADFVGEMGRQDDDPALDPALSQRGDPLDPLPT